ncbi:MAG TPA: extracellular solute-binding protein [Thermomicrobiales bacterium]|nr:extracellular solute-binding protein [Thermomicrobiales bacterium]
MRATRRELMIGGSAAAAALAIGASAQTEVQAQDKVKITWWHISTIESEKAAFQKLADDYVAANPNVEIEITVLENEAFKQKIATAMQSGEPPDIFQSWGGGVLFEYADAGLVKDISSDLAVDGWGESFLPAALGLFTRDGATYGAPWRIGMVCFWYNKDLFTQAGIEAPPTTWDELLTTAQTLKDAGITPITVGEGDKWPGHFYWVYLAIRTGGKAAFDAAYTGTGSFTDPPFVEAGTLLKELVDAEPFQDGFLGATYNEAAAVIANGEAAMELMGQWAPNTQKDESESGEGLGDKLGIFTFPAVADGAGAPSDVLGGGDGYGIGKNASPEAIDFVRYLTSVENQTALCAAGIAVPPAVEAAASAIADPLLQQVAQMAADAEYLQLYYDQYLPPAVGGAVVDNVQGIFAGSESPEEVAQAIQDSFVAEMGA